MSAIREDYQDGIITAEHVRTKEPPMYKVILLNDDYTTMDFVVHILQQIFHHSTDEAAQIMMNVHNNGRGVAGIYPKEIAETKAHCVHELAQEHEYPLKCVLEPDTNGE